MEHGFLITAKAAAKITNINSNKELKLVNDKIISAAHCGVSYIKLYDMSLKPETIISLQKAGYKISRDLTEIDCNNNYYGYVITIKW